MLAGVEAFSSSVDDKIHILYERYKNARATGDNTIALSCIDSLLILQSRIAEDVIKESITGVQRDFYTLQAIQEKARNSSLKNTVYLVILIFILTLLSVVIIFISKHKVQKEKLESKIETILSLKSYSDIISKEKDELTKSSKLQKKTIEGLNQKIKAHSRRIDILNREIIEKNTSQELLLNQITKNNIEFERIQTIVNQDKKELELLNNDLNKKGIELDRLHALLIEKDEEYSKMQKYIRQKEAEDYNHAQIVEKLFKEKWETLDMLCHQYFSLKNSELSSKQILVNIEKEIKRIVSPKGLSDIVESVNVNMGGIVERLREQCSFLKEEDINYMALCFAGFSVRAVCLFVGISYQNFYVKRKRLIERISKSTAPDKDMFVSKLK